MESGRGVNRNKKAVRTDPGGRTSLSLWDLTLPHTGSGSDLTALLVWLPHLTGRTLSQVFNLCQQGLKIFWCPVKDSNLQLSVSKTAAFTNFANWTWWGWMDLNQLCPKTNRFTVCRTSPSVPHPHVRGSISFGLGGWI